MRRLINWQWWLTWGQRVVWMLLGVEVRDQAWMILRMKELAAAGHVFAPIYLDSLYHVMPKDSWRKLLWVWRWLLLPYEAEWRDCEDYAGLLKALVTYLLGINGVAVVTDRNPDSPHEYCIVFFPNGNWEMVEAQNGKWLTRGFIQNGVAKV